jgi:hypothetical protein
VRGEVGGRGRAIEATAQVETRTISVHREYDLGRLQHEAEMEVVVQAPVAHAAELAAAARQPAPSGSTGDRLDPGRARSRLSAAHVERARNDAGGADDLAIRTGVRVVFALAD